MSFWFADPLRRLVMLIFIEYGKESMEWVHLQIFTLDLKAVCKSTDSGRAENMNEIAINLWKLGILLLLNAKQLGSPRGFAGLISKSWGNVSFSLHGLGLLTLTALLSDQHGIRAGHFQASFPGLVLLVLTVPSGRVNLTALCFLDISLQINTCRSSKRTS